MKTEDTAAIEEFREMYGDKAANALVQYLTKKRKDLTASEILADDGAFERFSNWAYTKLGIDVYERFAKHDVGGFFKRTNVEDFRKMRPGVDPNYNYFLRDLEGESKEVRESDDGISGLDDREIAKMIADNFEEITGTPVSDVFNKDLDNPDAPIFDQEVVNKTFPFIEKWFEDHAIAANRQDEIMYELDEILASKYHPTESDNSKLIKDALSGEERNLNKVDSAVNKFNELRKQAIKLMGDADGIYYETGSTLESAPRFVSSMLMDVDDKGEYVTISWIEEEMRGWGAQRVPQEDRAKISDEFEIDNIIDTINYMMGCIRRAMKYFKRNFDVDESIKDDDKITLTLGQIKQMAKEFYEKYKKEPVDEELQDKDITKVYDELKKTGKKEDEIGQVIAGMIASNESVKTLSRREIFEESDLSTNAYWNGNGKYQDLANKVSGVSVEQLIEKYKIPYSAASKFDRDRFQYFRFFNDGDTPEIFKKDIRDKYGEFPRHIDLDDDEMFNFIAPMLEALIDADLQVLKPYLDKVQDEDTSIEETAIFKKQLIIGDNNDGTITIMLTSQPNEDDKKMLRTLSGDENMDYKKDPEYSYWYASIKGKTPKEAEEQISQSFPDYAIEIDNDQDQIA